MKKVVVYDTPSGLGGIFTVSIVEDLGDTALVRVWYGRAEVGRWDSYKEWDGRTFTRDKAKLSNEREKVIEE